MSSRRARMILRAFGRLNESQRVAPMYLLLQAEDLKLRGGSSDVYSTYDAAILAASNQSFWNFETIANERAAGHSVDEGDRNRRDQYLQAAMRVAEEWSPLKMRWIQERFS